MSGKPRLVAVDEVPEERLLRLVTRGLGHGPAGERSREWWRWKHAASPFGPSYGLVAMDGDEPVALRIFLRWSFAAGQRRVDAVRAVDTVTHPAWRRRGLFRRLTDVLVERVRDDGVQLVFNTPNRFSRPGYLRMGWRRVARVPVLVRPLRPVALLAGLLPGGRSAERRAGDRPACDLPTAAELSSQPWLPDLLAAASPDGGRLRTKRSHEYLNWRYGRVPGIRYHALWDVGDGEGALVVVRPRRRRGLAEVSVAEIVVSSGADAAVRAVGLLREVAACCGGDYLTASAVRDSRERSILQRAGFRWPALPGPTFVVRPLAACEPDPLRRRSWQLGLGDLELL